MNQAKSVPSGAAMSAYWRAPGIVISAVLIAYLFFNVVRALIDPVAFAQTFGTPLIQASDVAFVQVYAVRTLFIALLGAALLLQRNLPALRGFLLVAVLMPVGDALIVAAAGGATATVGRHVIIAAIVAVTALLLRRVRDGDA